MADETLTGDGLENLTVDQLKTQLGDKGLPTTGNKPELIARLREADTTPPAAIGPEVTAADVDEADSDWQGPTYAGGDPDSRKRAAKIALAAAENAGDTDAADVARRQIAAADREIAGIGRGQAPTGRTSTPAKAAE